MEAGLDESLIPFPISVPLPSLRAELSSSTLPWDHSCGNTHFFTLLPTSLERVDLFLSKAFLSTAENICRTNPSFTGQCLPASWLDELLLHLNNLWLHCLTQNPLPLRGEKEKRLGQEWVKKTFLPHMRLSIFESITSTQSFSVCLHQVSPPSTASVLLSWSFDVITSGRCSSITFSPCRFPPAPHR